MEDHHHFISLLFLLTLLLIQPAVKGSTSWTASTFTTIATTTAGCPTGTFGSNCSSSCGNCYNGSTCDKVTGTCWSGCEPGWMLPSCSNGCPTGTFGSNCSSSCGNCYNGSTCDKVTGTCWSGCEPGWMLPSCSNECDAGYYGNNCSSKCSDNCKKGNCNKVNGSCSQCNDGFYRTDCQECPERQYGANCSRTCQNCKNGTSCDKATGECLLGCEPGWKSFPKNCLEACNSSFYGDNCSEKCGECYGECSTVNGNCRTCMENREMPLCQVCVSGWWGSTCSILCQHCGGSGRCDRLTGVCSDEVCQEGWRSPRCDQKCEAYKYGINCSKQCGHCAGNTSCRHDNGMCELDCEDGYEGVLCQKRTFVIQVIIGSALGAGGLITVAIVVTLCCINRRNRAKTPRHSDLIVLSPASSELEDPTIRSDNCNPYINHSSSADVTREYEAVVKDTESHVYNTSTDRMRDLPEPAYQNYGETRMTTTHSANNYTDDHLYTNEQ